MATVKRKRKRAEWTRRLSERQWRYIAAYGGRAGGKDYGIATEIVERMLQSPIKVVCAREIQSSIGDSVKSLIESSVITDLLGLQDYFTFTRSATICNVTGSSIVYKGLARNVRSLKGLESIDLAWLNEAENVSRESWEMLIPSIRKEGSQIFVSFNPRFENDIVSQHFIKEPRPDALILNVNWNDNPFLPDTINAERLYDFHHNTRYGSIWEGHYDYDYIDSPFPQSLLQTIIRPDKGDYPCLYGGIDPAFSDGENADYTAIVLGDADGNVGRIEMFRESDPEIRNNRIEDIIGNARCTIDATGGGGLYTTAELQRRGCSVEEFKFNRNNKVELVHFTADNIARGQFTIPTDHPDAPLLQQMRTFIGDGKGSYEAAPGEHDDLVTAFMLYGQTLYREPGFSCWVIT